MLKGFRDFITKGNVVDLAVAVIVGGAFGNVVNALVNSVLMPLIAALVGSPNFDSFALVTIHGNDIRFGVLITAVVNFVLIAAAIYFVILTPMNLLIARREAKSAVKNDPPALDPQIELLTEIRDSLRSRC